MALVSRVRRARLGFDPRSAAVHRHRPRRQPAGPYSVPLARWQHVNCFFVFFCFFSLHRFVMNKSCSLTDYAPLDTKQVISETFLRANLLAHEHEFDIVAYTQADSLDGSAGLRRRQPAGVESSK